MINLLVSPRYLCAQQTFFSKRFCRNASSYTSKSAIGRKTLRLPRVEIMDEHFDNIPPEDRNKKAFFNAIAVFQRKRTHLRGHVEFINAALKHLKEFGLHKDLDTYKALLNVFPKGPFIPHNNFQRIFVHYPMQQTCCIKLLDEMEWHGVQPDREVHDIVVNAFGNWNLATKKIKRMLYWMPKLKYTNKYIDRREIEGRQLSAVDLAFLALKTICRDPGTQFFHVKIKDVEKDEKENWIVGGQSPLQMQLINNMEPKSILYVDGPFFVYLMNYKVFYVTLTAEPNPENVFDNFISEEEDDDNFENWRSPWENGALSKFERNIHQQQDETILGLAVFGKTDRRWAAAWINHLLERNPVMKSMRVLIRLKEEKREVAASPSSDLEKEGNHSKVF